MAADDVFVLGDSIEAPSAGVEGRRWSVTIKSDRLVFQLSPRALGMGPAAAIVGYLRSRIEAIATVVAPATLKARAAYARGVARGKAWAVKRYGSSPPSSSDRLFNDSGRLAQALTATAGDDGSWQIMAPGDRLNAETLDGRSGGDDALAAIRDRLNDAVPELADPGQLVDADPVTAALQAALDSAITITKGSSDADAELARGVVAAAEAVDELAGG